MKQSIILIINAMILLLSIYKVYIYTLFLLMTFIIKHLFTMIKNIVKQIVITISKIANY